MSRAVGGFAWSFNASADLHKHEMQKAERAGIAGARIPRRALRNGHSDFRAVETTAGAHYNNSNAACAAQRALSAAGRGLRDG
jgi:hypothetical protein